MKRSIIITAWMILSTMLMVAISGGGIALAGGSYSSKDLIGTYHYVSTSVKQVRGHTVVDGFLRFCSSSGTITFDGKGTAWVVGTERCNADVEIEKNLNHYAVHPDGSFEIWNVDYPEDVFHCQITNNGNTILCDGTIPNPEILTFQAIGVK
jgi:hypothetical protein